MRGYNALNEIDIELEKCGICVKCGRRLTDPRCEHATPAQIEVTKKMDEEIDSQDIFGRVQDTEREIDARCTTTVHHRTNPLINGGVRQVSYRTYPVRVDEETIAALYKKLGDDCLTLKPYIATGHKSVPLTQEELGEGYDFYEQGETR